MASFFRPGKISIWALGLSVFVHAVLLGTFIFLKLAKASPKQDKQFRQASLSNFQSPINENRIYSKPKVVRTQKYTAKSYSLELPKTQPVSNSTSNRLEEISKSNLSELVPANTGNFLHEIEFYGNYANSKRACFIVDASGSMQGSFRAVKTRLSNSISNLKPDQFFSIIFYRNGEILQLPNMNFLRASKRNKLKAIEYMNTIRPLGTTNALSAIKKAYMTASQIDSESVIFFLTDGFELAESDAASFIQEIASYKKVLAPATRINTIGFNNDTISQIILQKVSEVTGGKYVKANN